MCFSVYRVQVSENLNFWIKSNQIIGLTFFTINDPQSNEELGDGANNSSPIEDTIAKEEESDLSGGSLEKGDSDDDGNRSSPNDGLLKTALYWICGIESMLKTKNKSQKNPVIVNKAIDTCIKEDRFYANVCNINAVIALCITGFIVAFFNKFD